jgi:hypothetical protein
MSGSLDDIDPTEAAEVIGLSAICGGSALYALYHLRENRDKWTMGFAVMGLALGVALPQGLHDTKVTRLQKAAIGMGSVAAGLLIMKKI